MCSQLDTLSSNAALCDTILDTLSSNAALCGARRRLPNETGGAEVLLSGNVNCLPQSTGRCARANVCRLGASQNVGLRRGSAEGAQPPAWPSWRKGRLTTGFGSFVQRPPPLWAGRPPTTDTSPRAASGGDGNLGRAPGCRIMYCLLHRVSTGEVSPEELLVPFFTLCKENSRKIKTQSSHRITVRKAASRNSWEKPLPPASTLLGSPTTFARAL